MDMNLNWVLEHKNGQVTAKKDAKGKLTPYTNKRNSEYAKRDNITTIALQESGGKTVVLVDVPDGAEVFQRHRGFINGGINYYSRFHNVNFWVDNITGAVLLTQVDNQQVQEPVITDVFDPFSRQLIPNIKKISKVIPEWTYRECWIVGYRKREANGTVTIKFKAVYPDGKIDEHTDFNIDGSKSWLAEPEYFAEEILDVDDKNAQIEQLKTKYRVPEIEEQLSILTVESPKRKPLESHIKHFHTLEAEYNRRFP
jgi:hypothetical protein